MCVVKANETRTVSSVQGQRVTQPMRTLRRHVAQLDLELDPMLAGIVDYKGFAIEREERVEALIATLYHANMLSFKDNMSSRHRPAQIRRPLRRP